MVAVERHVQAVLMVLRIPRPFAFKGLHEIFLIAIVPCNLSRVSQLNLTSSGDY